MGIRGVTVSDVRGFGAQGGSTERQAGKLYCQDFVVVIVASHVLVLEMDHISVLNEACHSYVQLEVWIYMCV